MSHPDEELLADLAVGADLEISPEVRDHVSGCPICTSTVEELRRVLALAAHVESPLTWSRPSQQVWSRIEETVNAQPATTPGSAEPAAPAAVPTLESRRTSRPPRRLLPWAAGMAAAGLAIGLLSGRALWRETPSPPAATIAQAELDTLDTKQVRGEASVVRSGGVIDLKIMTTAPLDAGDGFLEVWLINKDGKRMVSIGVLRSGAAELLPITQALIDQGYVIVDVSREAFDNKPQHSGDSLVRGTLHA